MKIQFTHLEPFQTQMTSCRRTGSKQFQRMRWSLSFPCHYNELWLELSSFKNDANAPIMYDKVVHMTCVLDLKSYCSFGWKTDCNLRHYSRIIFPQVGCYLENCSLSLIFSEKWLKFQGFFTQSCHMAPEELEYSHMNFFYDTFMVLLCPFEASVPIHCNYHRLHCSFCIPWKKERYMVLERLEGE